ncbi:alpha-amylase family glycosyl hydrolase [Streptococcus hongkongensis]
MAFETNKKLRNNLIYCIYTRHFSREGTFATVEKELDRIKKLGTDIIWFLPIYPIGQLKRKGNAGSPYAISDYRSINNELGTMADFEHLISEIHNRGMKVMIDIVFNHTSPDSLLVKEHPEWFYKKENGTFGNRVGDWTDIIDLDYSNLDLWNYQIETLTMWAKKGVDGFRCDVAPLVPLAFWKKARQAVSQINPDQIWLSESIDFGFLRELRNRKLIAHCDAEVYQAFDITYDYDMRGFFDGYLAGNISLSRYAEALSQQELIFPANYIKLRNLENHDTKRIASLVPDHEQLVQWTTFEFFQKGTTLLYNGQEVCDQVSPSLFETGVINWNNEYNISDYITKLAQLKKSISLDANYEIQASDQMDSIVLAYFSEKIETVGVFSFKGKTGKISVPLEDGVYINQITNQEIHVTDSQVDLNQTPIWISF